VLTRSSNPHNSRRGITLALAALLTVAVVGFVAFGTDVGRIVLVRTRLQAAADASAMAGAAQLGRSVDEVTAEAQQQAGCHQAGGRAVALSPADVELGTWDSSERRFTPTGSVGNAVRVTARCDGPAGGQTPLFFGAVLRRLSFHSKASAVAMVNPRDIAFVVDLSGSMNDDTEPCWASDAIDRKFGAQGSVGSRRMQQVYDDFGFGPYPGRLEWIGKQPWGVKSDKYAYAELTGDGGPLTGASIPAKYRISSSDKDVVRKAKAYSAIIDYQIARLMPRAKPAPDSSGNYGYWEKYLDYLIQPASSVSPKPSSSGSGRSGGSRGSLPPCQSSDRIDRFNNPNEEAFPHLTASVPQGFRNQIGYRTYVQFMMDFGRDLRPAAATYAPLSRHSPDCPRHDEVTAGGTFSFPPREQPVHSARRALIAAIQLVKEKNRGLGDMVERDRVSIVTFDGLSGGGPVIEQPLTTDYDAAMQACTRLQAVGDRGATRAVEAGLIAARDHIKPKDQGGTGRTRADKFVVLLTDGAPNLFVSSPSEIDAWMHDDPDPDYYPAGEYSRNAPLVKIAAMQAQKWRVFPVGIGLRTDYGYLGRMARVGGTDGHGGANSRGSGNPAEYEQRLTEIFRDIIANPHVRIVE
jgi:hypothetical protein